jgi:hypothetical protein
MSYFSHIQQDVQADANNSCSANLTTGSGYTFTGTISSTLGVAGIQVSLYSDKNCTVEVQQSPDTVPHWDLTDTYYYTAGDGFGITVQAVSSYFRVVVKTANEETTTFRLQTALCPIVEAVPRSLDENGHFKISNPVDSYGFEVENTPMGEMRMVEPFRLIGATFEGTTIDSGFWTTGSSGTGVPPVSQGGAQLTITSGSASGGTATCYSVRRARYVGGASMRYRAVVQASAGVANNTRRWGIGWGSSAMPTITDGAWFMLSGTTFQIQTMKGGVPSTVTTFNGRMGITYDPGTSVKTYEIYWSNSRVYFVVGGEILHIVSASSATWANTMNFHAFMDSVNSGTTTSSTLETRVATIYRLGKAETSPILRYIAGAVTGSVLKYGPGRLHRIILGTQSSAGTITIYNATTAANTIALITWAVNDSPKSIEFGADFYNGLTVTTTGTNTAFIFVFE